MTPRLIVGIGNIILRDEGVGVRVIERMRQMQLSLPATVELVDGGTSGADLIDVLADREKVVVIDAVAIDAPPGTVVRFSGEDLVAETVAPISLHQVGLVDTLLMARTLQCSPKQTVIFGIKPKDISPGLDLSPEIEAVIPLVIRRVVEEITG